MFASERNCVVAVHSTQAQAEHAVHELQARGFPMASLSLVGRALVSRGSSSAPDDVSGFELGVERRLNGSGVFRIPGLGTMLVGGPLVTSIMRAVECPEPPAPRDALRSGLGALGVPAANLRAYEELLKTGYFLVIAHGTTRLCMLAKSVLDRDGPPESRLYGQ